MRAPSRSPALLPADRRGSAMIHSPPFQVVPSGSGRKQAARALVGAPLHMWHNEAMSSEIEHATQLRRAVLIVAFLNLAYFGVEFAVATAIGSVSLFADSVDFLEDASINLLILVGLGWTASRRAMLGKVLAGILLVPSLATLWTAWDKFWLPLPPAPIPLTLAGTGALAVNLTCALILTRSEERSVGKECRSRWS